MTHISSWTRGRHVVPEGQRTLAGGQPVSSANGRSHRKPPHTTPAPEGRRNLWIDRLPRPCRGALVMGCVPGVSLADCQRSPALPCGLPAEGYLAPLGSLYPRLISFVPPGQLSASARASACATKRCG